MDTKNAFSSMTVQSLLVLLILSLAHFFKWAPPDSAVADGVKLFLAFVATLWGIIGTCKAHATPAQPLNWFGLVVQVASAVTGYAPQIQAAVGEFKVPPLPTPQSNAGQNG